MTVRGRNGEVVELIPGDPDADSKDPALADTHGLYLDTSHGGW